MFGSAPQALPPHEVAALQLAGVGMVPHQSQVTPLTGVQLTNVRALSSLVQSAVVHDRSMCVKPVRVAAVPQLGKTLVPRVLVLTMFTLVVTISLATRASG